jgi:L-ascorbate metabolism protein UlaG (beta-lactamase superfamily)
VRPIDLDWCGRAPLGGRGDVRVRWLGTAGFAVEHGGHVVLFDPYLTRASLRRVVVSHLVPDEALVARVVPRASAIVLSHTHFDHALDAPAIARATGARVFGSRSALALCRAKGVAEAQLELCEPAPGAAVREAEVGPMRLRFWPSAHSRFFFGRVPAAGEITDCDALPMRAEAYRCGAVFGTELEVAGRRLYHLGSAELVERGLGVKPVDLLMACVAGWTSTERYPERAVAAFQPGAVLLHHWDNFLHPLARPAEALPAMRLERLVERLHAAGRGVPVGTLPLLGDITL